MKRLEQTLCTKTDSFSYTVVGEDTPTYHVDSSGYLTERGKAIGKFCLGDKQWHLRIDGVIVDSGPENGLFYLPEFELRSLTALINKA
jgi:hypothetical protein